ncbi:WD40/YVTN/BNR-like repeat-containing protein [Burkholderia sp. MR1-5-21]
MKRKNFRPSSLCLFASLWSAIAMAGDGSLPTLTVKPVLQIHAAERIDAALHAQILGVTRVGRRIVAVGDHGVILLSDDEGRTFRQARGVPVDSTLTSVSFADNSNGWAVGHWGVIIRTEDGGETWKLQRSDLHVDQPLFSVHFTDSRKGWAVGLWSMMLHTENGGESWDVIQVPPAPGAKKADRNFYSVFGGMNGTLYVACEQGLVMHSGDGGATWTYTQTGYGGSLWTGTVLPDGVVLVGGLRGTILRSPDGGQTWKRISTTYKNSITDFALDRNGKIVATSLDGVVLTSTDDGISFEGAQRPDREALTAVVNTIDGQPVPFSQEGALKK